ncbi:MAG TPA: ROK family transcriptional regulator [Anaerolineaceae bacterium]|nr:ROK family transcriptional regulator [Anaerolineaceae bacterium]
MIYNKTISGAGMRTINRTAIIDLIRREAPLSRSYIARTLGISLPTVMRSVDELVQERLVRPLTETEWSGGRRRSLIELNTSENAVIGINLGDNNTFGAIADIGGNILKEIEIPRNTDDPEENFTDLVGLIESLMAAPEIGGMRVLGIGVGAPGVTRHKQGLVVWAPTLNWRDFPLRERLAEKFELPIIVDNDVNLMALGEMWYGAGKNLKNIVVITLGAGTGSAIVVDGFLYRGTHEAAGEIGYQVPDRAALGSGRKPFGSMERIASGVGIAERARRQLAGILPDDQLKSLTAKDIFDAVRRGEGWAEPIFNETVEYFSLMVSSISAILDPEVIIFSGGISRAADLFIPRIMEHLAGLQPAGVELNLKQSPLGLRGVVLGAITIVLNHTSEQYVVRLIE